MTEAAPMSRAGVHYLEDLAAGMRFSTAGRTITEADVVAFAGLSGDFNVIHTDAEYAKSSVYGQRVVYGLLGLSIATGLLDRLGTFSGSAIAMLGITDWRFTAPIFIGDTVHLELTVLAVRPSRSKPDRGVVERQFEIVNQHGAVVQAGRIDVLVRRDPRGWAPAGQASGDASGA
jgi:acyl dehydratase